ncbi:hypothetical protein BOFE_09090 (plasmid) [Candidatus Borrelia fainii]|uniref:Immunogenic protein A n=1 Tax=Candidatus Borrelia fainii TaxID=2518322 RepID=A0ABN6USK1_9SPIR|nr:hypothetical protein [Candidatus Borrelia fainii]BDU63369.1 hypothetical protein BOFE_09090 [Candidatus Borrelia fainii]
MRNFSIIVLLLTTLTLSCKPYNYGSVQRTKSFVDSPLLRPDRVGQEVAVGGREIEKAVSRNLGVADVQRKDTADVKNGDVVARKARDVLQKAGNAIQRDVDGSVEGLKNDVIQNLKGAGVQVAVDGAKNGGAGVQVAVGSAENGDDRGQVAVGSAENGDDGGQEAGKVSQNLGDTGTHLNFDLGVENKGDISSSGMSTNYVTGHVTENRDSIDSITSTSSKLDTALQIAGASTSLSGYEGEVTTNTQDRTFVETGTQESKTQRYDFSSQDMKDKILGSVVSGSKDSESMMSLSSNASSEAKDKTVVLSYDVISKGNDVAVDLSSNETQMIDRLEKYLQSAIKINGISDSEQSKLESGRKKFFNWLKTSDTDASKRKALVQDLQKVFALIKEKSSNSVELQNWIEIIVYDIEDKSTIVDIGNDDELNSDQEIDFLIKNTLSSRNYSGFAVSLLFQSLADTLYDSENNHEKSEEQIFNDLRKVFSDSSTKSGGVLEFKSKIEAIN